MLCVPLEHRGSRTSDELVRASEAHRADGTGPRDGRSELVAHELSCSNGTLPQARAGAAAGERHR